MHTRSRIERNQFWEICKTVLKLVGKMIYQFNSIKFENCRAQQLGREISTVLAKASLRTAKPFWSQRLTNQIASLNNSVKKFLTWIHRFSLTVIGVTSQRLWPIGMIWDLWLTNRDSFPCTDGEMLFYFFLWILPPFI